MCKGPYNSSVRGGSSADSLHGVFKNVDRTIDVQITFPKPRSLIAGLLWKNLRHSSLSSPAPHHNKYMTKNEVFHFIKHRTKEYLMLNNHYNNNTRF